VDRKYKVTYEFVSNDKYDNEVTLMRIGKDFKLLDHKCTSGVLVQEEQYVVWKNIKADNTVQELEFTYKLSDLCPHCGNKITS
jgi:hypothetical protein